MEQVVDQEKLTWSSVLPERIKKSK